MTYIVPSNLLKVFLSAGKDPRRHALHRVEIAFGVTGVSVAATDGMMLAVSTGGLPVPEKDATTFLILATTIKNILSSVPTKGTDIAIEKTADGTRIAFTSKAHAQVVVIDKPEELSFPNWQEIMESCRSDKSSRAGVYAVKPALFGRALDIVASYVGKDDGGAAIVYTPPAFNKAIFIEAQDEHGLGEGVDEVKIIVMPTGIPESHHARKYV
jgi:hypothetical protein